MMEKHDAQTHCGCNLVMDKLATGTSSVQGISGLQGTCSGTKKSSQGTQEDSPDRQGSASGHDGSVEAVCEVMVRELAEIARAEVEREMAR